MTELEINRQRAQLLVKARALLNEEYLKNRTNEYEMWQAESNRMWISQGILLPCPNKFTYPTEEAVVARALELYNKQAPVIAPTASAVQPNTEINTSSVSARLAEVSQKFKPVVLPAVSDVSPWEQHLGPAIALPIEPEPVATPIDIPLPDLVPVVESLVEDVIAKEEIEEEVDEPMTEEEVIEEAKRNSKLRSLLAKFITMAKTLDSKAEKDQGTSK
jgi:hypothetical protein